MGRGVLWHKLNVNNISIHPSRVGWDVELKTLRLGQLVFQSTHPVWDGTSPLL